MSLTPQQKTDMMSEIHAALTSKDADNDLAKAFRGGGIQMGPDLKRELGLERRDVVRHRQLQASTDPNKFDEERKKREAAMLTDINASYYTAYDQFIQAGLTEDDARKKATSMAKTVKASQQEAIDLEFGQDNQTNANARRVVKQAHEGTGVKFN
jgi:hypothetical protein